MTTLISGIEPFSFELPSSLAASEPPEARGFARDHVRMLVAYRSTRKMVSTSFDALTSFLVPGDLVVVNTSGTIPAALDAVGVEGTSLVIHLSTQLDETRWVVEPRRRAERATERWRGPLPARRFHLRGGAMLNLERRYGDGDRLWVATMDLGEPVLAWLDTHASPIRYAYAAQPWPLAMYQNVYATEFGSAEMPSAGRPFTTEMITRLVAMGVEVAPLILHTGVASLEDHERPYPERVTVPALTSARVNATRRAGHRVLAVGTTAVRALETAVGPDGLAHSFDGWTDLVISPETSTRVVDGLLTGWHEPVSSHLLMLEAIGGRDLLEDSYHAALVQGYRWHEFGDVHLILP